MEVFIRQNFKDINYSLWEKNCAQVFATDRWMVSSSLHELVIFHVSQRDPPVNSLHTVELYGDRRRTPLLCSGCSTWRSTKLELLYITALIFFFKCVHAERVTHTYMLQNRTQVKCSGSTFAYCKTTVNWNIPEVHTYYKIKEKWNVLQTHTCADLVQTAQIK